MHGVRTVRGRCQRLMSVAGVRGRTRHGLIYHGHIDEDDCKVDKQQHRMAEGTYPHVRCGIWIASYVSICTKCSIFHVFNIPHALIRGKRTACKSL